MGEKVIHELLKFQVLQKHFFLLLRGNVFFLEVNVGKSKRVTRKPHFWTAIFSFSTV
jgi:hypothetical protein